MNQKWTINATNIIQKRQISLRVNKYFTNVSNLYSF